MTSTFPFRTSWFYSSVVRVYKLKFWQNVQSHLCPSRKLTAGIIRPDVQVEVNCYVKFHLDLPSTSPFLARLKMGSIQSWCAVLYIAITRSKVLLAKTVTLRVHVHGQFNLFHWHWNWMDTLQQTLLRLFGPQFYYGQQRNWMASRMDLNTKPFEMLSNFLTVNWELTF